MKDGVYPIIVDLVMKLVKLALINLGKLPLRILIVLNAIMKKAFIISLIMKKFV
jgi:hypothetical protein